MKFLKAFRELPEGTGYDYFAHKNVLDLAWICLHELDMHAEGEFEHPLKLRKQYLKFINKWGSEYMKSEAKRVFDIGMNQTEWHIV